jgi:hypothetical protein
MGTIDESGPHWSRDCRLGGVAGMACRRERKIVAESSAPGALSAERKLPRAPIENSRVFRRIADAPPTDGRLARSPFLGGEK